MKRLFLICTMKIAIPLVVAATAVGCAGLRPATPPPSICAGVVTDEKDQPVADASITVYQPPYHRVDDAPLVVVAEGMTASDGSFSLNPSVNDSSILIVAERADLATGWKWSRATDREPLAITMRPAVPISGLVVDEAEVPIPNALVLLTMQPRRPQRHRVLRGKEAIASLSTTTDADGRFIFRNLPRDWKGAFCVRSEGKAEFNTFNWWHDKSQWFDPDDKDIKLTLEPESRIEVQLIHNGVPLSGVDLPLAVDEEDSERRRLGHCSSLEEGRFVFDRLQAGEYSFFLAQAAGATAKWAVVPQSIRLKAGEARLDVELELVEGGMVEVKVRDKLSRKPVPGAFGAVSSTTAWSGLQSMTGNDGVLRFRMPPGEYNVPWCEAPGYSRATPRTEVFKVKTGKRTTRVVRLFPKSGFEGTAVDSSGKVVPDTLVSLLPDWQYDSADKAGQFSLEKELYQRGFLEPLMLVGRNPERNLAGAVELREPAGDIELPLTSAVTVAGRIIDSKGAAVPEASAKLTLEPVNDWKVPPLGNSPTGADGLFKMEAIPPGLDFSIRLRAEGFAARELPLVGPSGGGRIDLQPTVMHRVNTNVPAPEIRELALPYLHDPHAIWGGTGRDSRGHIWIGICGEGVKDATTYLLEYIPDENRFIKRGDAVSELKRTGAWRRGESQNKIHTKIVQANDGYLYFATMDEIGRTNTKPPKFKSHLWRLKIGEDGWEHLLAVPEGLTAISTSGRYVYSLGLWTHMLYQYDTQTGKTQSVEVGSVPGHISRNFLSDYNGHAYVPHVTSDESGKTVELVEYDASLKEIARTPMKYFFEWYKSHGITGHTTLPNGDIAFVTHNGWLSLVKPSAEGPAEVIELGWLHPDGPRYMAVLFSDDAGKKLMTLSAPWGRVDMDWITYDLETGEYSLVVCEAPRQDQVDMTRSLLYGSDTRDNEGNCYIVGVLMGAMADRRGGAVAFQFKPSDK